MPKYKKLSQMFTETLSPNAQEYYDPEKETEENKQSLSEQITEAIKPKAPSSDAKPEEKQEPSAFEGLKTRLKEAGNAFLEQQRQKDADYKAGLFAQNERLNQLLKKPSMGPELPPETLPIEQEVARQTISGTPMVGSIKGPTAAAASHLEEGVQKASEVAERIKALVAAREAARQTQKQSIQDLAQKVESLPTRAIDLSKFAEIDQWVNSIPDPAKRQLFYDKVTELLKHSQKIAGQK